MQRIYSQHNWNRNQLPALEGESFWIKPSIINWIRVLLELNDGFWEQPEQK